MISKLRNVAAGLLVGGALLFGAHTAYGAPAAPDYCTLDPPCVNCESQCKDAGYDGGTCFSPGNCCVCYG